MIDKLGRVTGDWLKLTISGFPLIWDPFNQPCLTYEDPVYSSLIYVSLKVRDWKWLFKLSRLIGGKNSRFFCLVVVVICCEIVWERTSCWTSQSSLSKFRPEGRYSILLSKMDPPIDDERSYTFFYFHINYIFLISRVAVIDFTFKNSTNWSSLSYIKVIWIAYAATFGFVAFFMNEPKLYLRVSCLFLPELDK